MAVTAEIPSISSRVRGFHGTGRESQMFPERSITCTPETRPGGDQTNLGRHSYCLICTRSVWTGVRLYFLVLGGEH